jgi:hypothetical protein
MHDDAPDAVAHVGLGPELICFACHTWARKMTRWFLVKTRRMPARDTPAQGIPRVEPSASPLRMSL